MFYRGLKTTYTYTILGVSWGFVILIMVYYTPKPYSNYYDPSSSGCFRVERFRLLGLTSRYRVLSGFPSLGLEECFFGIGFFCVRVCWGL